MYSEVSIFKITIDLEWVTLIPSTVLNLCLKTFLARVVLFTRIVRCSTLHIWQTFFSKVLMVPVQVGRGNLQKLKL